MDDALPARFSVIVRVTIALVVAIGFLTLTTLESRRLAWTVVAAAAAVLAFWLWSVWGRRLGARARKWRRRLLYSGVGLASIVLALLNGLPEVVERWVTGGSTEELQLGFTTMAWWGRIGKLLQFIAALVVLIDLADSNRLRAIGARAGLRQRGIDPKIDRRTGVSAYLRAADWLTSHVVTRRVMLGAYALGHQHTTTGDPELVDPPVTHVPDHLPLSDLDYHVLHAWFKGEVADKPIAPEHERQLEAMALKVVTDQLSDSERMQVEKARQRRELAGRAVGPAVFFFGALVLGIRFALDPGDWYTLTLAAIAIAGTVGLSLGEGKLYERWLHALYLPQRVVAESLAQLLDRERPAHPLRWLAFFIFLYGFALDLLAS
ncbi:hypothetical protein ACTMTF_46855 [Nonomuraea sp. ZG12]|uniref:hypothetical protein n=1 Tax=Nonomuraea sp. ZG12 TaxID=3452207 RepID=UPI003F88B9DA